MEAIAAQPEGAAAAALGASLAGQLSSGAHAVFGEWVQRSGQLVRPAANSTPALLPVVLTRCSQAVFAVFEEEERRSASFAAGWDASFRDAWALGTEAARSAGMAAYLRPQ
ncbi:hypothetical protein ABPG75_006547 [Micractinium tetrahymenae]